ncbi:helix-turn-helix domain-containing protein [Nocardia yamanashiensis]|uniref:PucR family transcriptional regulator n=1 Tax=Nocardia yamanashiensis TaxID=209247 RepID=UPI001E361CB8|nr:helix-turn-helix domain-containing protein [Nocardia yamanashiensis]UGT42958.1 helix-turn-helix domain-containing protein [Nocardia yamanashiensis]
MSTAAGGPAAPFVAFLGAHVNEVAREMVAAILQVAPEYQQLPYGGVEQDVVRRAEDNLRLFLRLLAEGREPRPADLEAMIEVAVRRAREGISLETVLAVYHRGALAAWNYLVAAARTDTDREELLAAVPQLLGYLGAVVPGVAASYLRERQDLHWEQREVKRALALALLQGKPAELLAERFGLALHGFHVLALRAGPEGPEGVRPALRVIHGELEALSPQALSVLDRNGGWVLLPHSEPVARLDTAVARIAAATSLRLVAGSATAATVAEIPARAEEAIEIARLAWNLNRPTGVYRMADLALQYQFARPGPARAWLLGLLEPLSGQPHLMDALRAYLAHDHNRVAAAESLVVHRNTLNYRLGRIATLTGYDPGRSEHTPLFAAALTALDLSAGDL